MAIIEIPLTHGQVAVVDEEDYPVVGGLSWRFHISKGARTGYAIGRYSGSRKIIYMHRKILGLTDDSIKCDHRDGNGLNNRRQNLRIATPLQNSRNRRKNANSSNRFKGVRYRSGGRTKPWVAGIGSGVKGRWIYLGYFATEEEAARAYDRAALERFGEFAQLNFPDEIQ